MHLFWEIQPYNTEINGALVGGVLGALIVIATIVAAIVSLFIILFKKGTSMHFQLQSINCSCNHNRFTITQKTTWSVSTNTIS